MPTYKKVDPFKPDHAERIFAYLATHPQPWFYAKEGFLRGERGVGYVTLAKHCLVYDALGQTVSKDILEPFAWLLIAAGAHLDASPTTKPTRLVDFAALVAEAHDAEEKRRLAQLAQSFLRPSRLGGSIVPGGRK
jgi:hypothetical protein